MIQAIGLTSMLRPEPRRTWLRSGRPDRGQGGTRRTPESDHRPALGGNRRSGLGSSCRPVLDDVSLEAPTGRVTALLGTAEEGRTAVRLMLGLEPGRGITCFRGRPLHRIAHPAREVGVLLGEVPGHPRRTVRGHLRLLCAAAGLPAARADDVLEAMGLVSLRGEPLGTLSRGLDRQLGMACALLPEPPTLVLVAPAADLAAREARWLHGLLRAHAGRGGTVLFTTGDPAEAARTADRVVTLKNGRVVADQEAQDFARTRLRPRAVVRTPHAARLGMLLAREARADRRTVEVVQEGGNRLAVYGSSCAGVGDTAYRHGIPVHQLAEEAGDMGAHSPAPGQVAAPRPTAPPGTVAGASAATEGGTAEAEMPDATAAREAFEAADTLPLPAPLFIPGSPGLPSPVPSPAPSPSPPLPLPPSRPLSLSLYQVPPLPLLPPSLPARSTGPFLSLFSPLRYELLRAVGAPTGRFVASGVVLGSMLLGLVLVATRHVSGPGVLAAWPGAWPDGLLLPPALGAGLLGALAAGDEARHPLPGAGGGNVRWRLGLLAARLLVATLMGTFLVLLALAADVLLLYCVSGFGTAPLLSGWPALAVNCLLVTVSCAWTGVLTAGVCRSAVAGLTAAVAVPLVGVPLLHGTGAGPAVRGGVGGAGITGALGVPGRGPGMVPGHGESGTGHAGEGAAVAEMVTQPVGIVLMLSLLVLFCALLFLRFRDRAR